jgi:hypothetical protein
MADSGLRVSTCATVGKVKLGAVGTAGTAKGPTAFEGPLISLFWTVCPIQHEVVPPAELSG